MNINFQNRPVAILLFNNNVQKYTILLSLAK